MSKETTNMEEYACDICGEVGSVSTRTTSGQAIYLGTRVALAEQAHLHCDACGEDYYTPEQASTLDAAVKKAAKIVNT